MKLAEYVFQHRPKRNNLAPQQAAALCRFQKSPRTQKELARDLGIQANAAHSLIFRMKKKGLIQKSEFRGEEIVWRLHG